jgi:hypothetical protein
MARSIDLKYKDLTSYKPVRLKEVRDFAKERGAQRGDLVPLLHWMIELAFEYGKKSKKPEEMHHLIVRIK